jgi:hypothetical protein
MQVAIPKLIRLRQALGNPPRDQHLQRPMMARRLLGISLRAHRVATVPRPPTRPLGERLATWTKPVHPFLGVAHGRDSRISICLDDSADSVCWLGFRDICVRILCCICPARILYISHLC